MNQETALKTILGISIADLCLRISDVSSSFHYLYRGIKVKEII